MTVEIAIVLSVISVAVSFYYSVHNSKRADTSEIERKATETATINVKLDDIGGDVKDIKYDISSVKKDVQSLNEKLIIVEQSTKSAHKRLDTLERRLDLGNPREETEE